MANKPTQTKHTHSAHDMTDANITLTSASNSAPASGFVTSAFAVSAVESFVDLCDMTYTAGLVTRRTLQPVFRFVHIAALVTFLLGQHLGRWYDHEATQEWFATEFPPVVAAAKEVLKQAPKALAIAVVRSVKFAVAVAVEVGAVTIKVARFVIALPRAVEVFAK